MAVRECPRCRLISAAEAQACDCRYEFATGVLRAQRSARNLSRSEREEVATTADAYRSLVVLALLQALLGAGSRVAAHVVKVGGRDEEILVASLVSLGALVVLAVLVAGRAHRAAQGMGLSNPAGWALAVFFGGILGVALLNSRARAWSERHDIRFGLLGPNSADVERFAG